VHLKPGHFGPRFLHHTMVLKTQSDPGCGRNRYASIVHRDEP
jgi:hypothetical protein